MNDLIKINHAPEQPTVLARDLHEVLKSIDNFKDFFVEVSKMKVSMEMEGLKTLIAVTRSYAYKFGAESIAYLTDSISTEMVLPFKILDTRKSSEKKMKEQIVNNFNSIFPKFSFVCCEKQVDGIGRIDIYALHEERSVIIELKTGNKNPNSQLIAYGSKFENPILIGITELEISGEKKIKGITYYTLEQLKRGVEQWGI